MIKGTDWNAGSRHKSTRNRTPYHQPIFFRDDFYYLKVSDGQIVIAHVAGKLH